MQIMNLLRSLMSRLRGIYSISKWSNSRKTMKTVIWKQIFQTTNSWKVSKWGSSYRAWLIRWLAIQVRMTFLWSVRQRNKWFHVRFVPVSPSLERKIISNIYSLGNTSPATIGISTWRQRSLTFSYWMSFWKKSIQYKSSHQRPQTFICWNTILLSCHPSKKNCNHNHKLKHSLSQSPPTILSIHQQYNLVHWSKKMHHNHNKHKLLLTLLKVH